ncbi:MAG: chorismate synthase [Acidobacteria bacterium]|nr:chorismate synthase [Planctomycetota bacterium]MBE3132061.1 chorismate synthase [Acidobacteriota bacterium]
MAQLVVRTAGESHGPAVVTLVEGFPAGVPVDPARIDADLARRQGGYGRGGRMQIEKDRVEVLAGVRHGRTLPGPVVLVVRNRDSRLEEAPEVFRPRPGHADLSGALKYLDPDVRNVLERASARETAGRVAAGGLAKALLAEFGIDVVAWVSRIGPAVAGEAPADTAEIRRRRDASDVYCPDPQAAAAMKAAIDAAREAGDTLGGVIDCVATGVPPGLGSHVQWTEKLDGRIARAVMSIQAIKGVEIGLGYGAAKRPGSEVHDPITYDAEQRGAACLGFLRPTNHAGGIEGGMTNGAPVVVSAAMKPISTLRKPLASVDLKTKGAEEAAYERSDVCAVPAASVVVEAVVATELAAAIIDRFGGDTLRQMKAACEAWRRAAMDL